MSATAQEGTADKSGHQLQAILPDWCALSWQHALICFTFLILFLHLSYLPVPTGQIWHEVANGRTIVSSGTTAADPALPYSEGIRKLQTSWLGQSLVYRIYSFGGAEWLSCAFALLQMFTLAIWAFVFQRISGRRWTALLVAPIVLASSIDVNSLGASTFGLLMFALIALTMVGTVSRRDQPAAADMVWSSASTWRWIVVIGLFILWANFDVSVLIGVGLLAMLTASRLVGVLSKRDNHESVLADKELHHRTWLFELCLVATLIQPAGLGLWKAVFWSANNPIVHALGGWSPVAIASWRGAWIAIAWLGWIVASRKTHRIPYWNTACAIFVTVVVACFQSQIIWFATTMCLLSVSLLPQLANPRFGNRRPAQSKEPQSNSNSSLKFAFTLVCGLLIWMAFTLSPIGSMAMAGKSRTTAQVFGSKTPLGATAYLKGNRPAKVVWTPKYWADHLQVEGEPTKVLANLNDAALTPRIEKDYQSIYYGGKNWQRLLRRYQIDDLVVDKENQTDLMRELRVDAGPFKKVFEDEISVVYRRTKVVSNLDKPTETAKTKSKLNSNPEKPVAGGVRFRLSKVGSAKFDTEDTDWIRDEDQPVVQQNVDQNAGEQSNLNATLTTSSKAQWAPAKPKPAAAKLFGDRPTSSTSVFED